MSFERGIEPATAGPTAERCHPHPPECRIPEEVSAEERPYHGVHGGCNAYHAWGARTPPSTVPTPPDLASNEGDARTSASRGPPCG